MDVCLTLLLLSVAAGFTALREALGMTSTTGLDEPELSDSDTADGVDNQQQQHPVHSHALTEAAADTAAADTAASEAEAGTQPAAAPAATAGPSLPARPRDKGRAPLSEQQKARHAQAVQEEVLQARSLGGPADWDLDWLTDPDMQDVHSAPAT